MIKIIPVHLENYQFNLDDTIKQINMRPIEDLRELLKEDSNDKSLLESLQELFDSIYTEDPEFWWNGLNTKIYSAPSDKIFYLDYKTTPVGFIGIQPNRVITELQNGSYGDYISVGISPDFRGKGIASSIIPKVLKELICDMGCKLSNPIWTVLSSNKASIKLFNKINNDDFVKHLKIKLIIEPTSSK